MIWKTAMGALILVLLLHGCTAKSGGQSKPPVPSAAPAGLTEITPTQFAAFEPVVNRYFYFRKQAVVQQNADALYREFPDLAQGTDKAAMVNAESDVVARYRGMDVIDGNVQPEHYARFLVREDGDKAAVLVNGMELYLRKDFGKSGGQLQLLLFLERRGGAWTVVRTDETTVAEYHQALR